MPSWLIALKSLVLTLKFRLTLVSLAALGLGIAVISVSLVNRAEEALLTAQQARELDQSVRTAAVLARRVADFQAALRRGAQDLDRATLADPTRLQAYLDHQQVLRGLFSSVFIADVQGRVRVISDEQGTRPSTLEVGDRAYFKRLLALGHGVVSEAVTSRGSGHPVVIVLEPVWRDGRVQAVLGGALRLASQDLVADLVEHSDGSGSALIVTDASGQVLAASDHQRQLGAVADGDPRFGKAAREWRSQGAPMLAAGKAFRQPGQLITAVGVPGPGWMVWRSLPEHELLAPLRGARQQAMVSAFGLMAALALLLWSLFARLLEPLTRLSQRARRLFDGGAHDLGWPTDGSEIGELARVLRHVAAERAQLETFNSEVLNKLVSVMSAAPVGIAFTRSGKFELVSAEFCRLIGRSEGELLGQPTRIIYARPDDDYAAIGQQVVAAFLAGQPYLGEWQMVRADGSLFWAELRGRPVLDSNSQAGTIWTVSDVSAQVEERETLAWSATHDTLTGLSNRRGFLQRLEQLYAGRAEAQAAELIVIDLDRFKPINDLAGHAAGDAMLKLVAAAISARVRASDLVVRTGGDEFAVLLAQCNHEAALRIAETIRNGIQGIVLSWEQHRLRVGASLGVATLGVDTASVAAWLAGADEACYAAKAEGRGLVRSASKPMLQLVGKAPATLAISADLPGPAAVAT